MTINELEQAIRNLIASQQSTSSSEGADVINSALSMIYSYRELVYKIQNHPYNDALKINMINSINNLESTLVISVCQVLQEKGINLMLYAPASKFGVNTFSVPVSNELIGSSQNTSSQDDRLAKINSAFEEFKSTEQDYDDDLSQRFIDEEDEHDEVEETSEDYISEETNETSEETEQNFEQEESLSQTNTNTDKKVSPEGNASGRDYLLELLKK